jgi:hypothetical protein
VSGVADISVHTTNSAELCDPRATNWSRVANMHYSREDHRATVLANGNLLVTGKTNDDSSTTDSAELFCPSLDITHTHKPR